MAPTIERCIHEFGLASQPVVEQLIEDVRAAEIVHLDETPWYQRGVLLWLWVAVTATTVVGSRFYAAGLSVIETCRGRGADPWTYACTLIAAARANLKLPLIPAMAAD